MSDYRWWQLAPDSRAPQGFAVACSGPLPDLDEAVRASLQRHLDEHRDAGREYRVAADELRSRPRFPWIEQLNVPPLLWLIRSDRDARIFIADADGAIRTLRLRPPLPTARATRPADTPELGKPMINERENTMTRRLIPQPIRNAAWALLGTIIGLVFLIGGITDATASAPDCGASTMETDDICHEWGDGWSDDSDFDQELSGTRRGGVFAIGGGVAVLVGTGFAVRYWAKRRQLPGQTG